MDICDFCDYKYDFGFSLYDQWSDITFYYCSINCLIADQERE
jgi:hypothetical protein